MTVLFFCCCSFVRSFKSVFIERKASIDWRTIGGQFDLWIFLLNFNEIVSLEWWEINLPEIFSSAYTQVEQFWSRLHSGAQQNNNNNKKWLHAKINELMCLCRPLFIRANRIEYGARAKKAFEKWTNGSERALT